MASHGDLILLKLMGASGKLLTKNGKITEGGKLKMWTCTPPLPIPEGSGPGPGPQGPPWGIGGGGVQVHIFWGMGGVG